MKKYNFEKSNLCTTELICILDASGSMSSRVSATISGFNEFIQSEKAENPDLVVSVITFSDHDKIKPIYNRVRACDIETLTEKQYRPCGMTALLDAVGSAINTCQNFQQSLNSEERPKNTIVMIMTDGDENDSRTWSLDSVKALISSKKDQGWQFIFLGTNIDAFSAGNQLGLRSSSISYENSDRGYLDSWKLARCCVNSAYASGDISLSTNCAKFSTVSSTQLK